MRATVKPLQLELLDYTIPLAPRPLARAFVAEVRSRPVALQAWFGFLLALMAVMGLAARKSATLHPDATFAAWRRVFASYRPTAEIPAQSLANQPSGN